MSHVTGYIQVRQSFERRRTKQEILLGSTKIRLWATYLLKTDMWYFDIRDVDDNALVVGVPCVDGINLLLPYRYMRGVPKGVLFCFHRSGAPPSFATLDGSGRLYYAEGTD